MYLGGCNRARLTTSDTDCGVMFLFLQYAELIQSTNNFVPLLALQETQHRAIFSLVMILSSLVMCSHDAFDFLVPHEPNSIPQ